MIVLTYQFQQAHLLIKIHKLFRKASKKYIQNLTNNFFFKKNFRTSLKLKPKTTYESTVFLFSTFSSLNVQFFLVISTFFYKIFL